MGYGPAGAGRLGAGDLARQRRARVGHSSMLALDKSTRGQHWLSRSKQMKRAGRRHSRGTWRGGGEAQGLMHDGGAGTSLVAGDADPGQFGPVRRGSRPAWKNSGDVGAAATGLGEDAGSAVAGDGQLEQQASGGVARVNAGWLCSFSV